MSRASRVDGGLVVLTGSGQSALLDVAGREVVTLPHPVASGARNGGTVALLAAEEAKLSILAGARLETWTLESLRPREVAVGADGTVAVRGERVVLELSGGEARVVYDGRFDPALPGPAEPFLRWRLLHGLPAGTTDAFEDADRSWERLPEAPCMREVAAMSRRLDIPVPTPSELPETLEAFLDDFPGHSLAPSLWGEAARRWRAAGRRDRAVAALEAAARISQGPRNRDRSLDLELVQILQEEGRHDRAVVELEELLARLEPTPTDPTVFEASFLKGQILAERLGRAPEAIPLYERLIEDYASYFPDDVDLLRRDKVRLYLGMALEAAGRPSEALPQYEAIRAESVTGAFVHYATERAERLRGHGSGRGRAAAGS